ncbi:hypothetical protein BO71DRAFT_435538 [Aspergillus ellipticus CBS 707.79]|uniref:Uncharacterized protein n=1 Tax=Aspergillus ellipticus CBS 707.79 TaxID=1448320 RepID=A0A319CTP9_9EURO|nr:hypothetical protein BO71DRAFT_435538 [Aspergillus ellipticus CBS 707.79]
MPPKGNRQEAIRKALGTKRKKREAKQQRMENARKHRRYNMSVESDSGSESQKDGATGKSASNASINSVRGRIWELHCGTEKLNKIWNAEQKAVKSNKKNLEKHLSNYQSALVLNETMNKFVWNMHKDLVKIACREKSAVEDRSFRDATLNSLYGTKTGEGGLAEYENDWDIVAGHLNRNILDRHMGEKPFDLLECDIIGVWASTRFDQPIFVEDIPGYDLTPSEYGLIIPPEKEETITAAQLNHWTRS